MEVCKVDYCESSKKVHGTTGLCENHHARWRRGSPDWDKKTPYEMTLMERFWSKVDFNGPVPDTSLPHISDKIKNSGPCWVWTGAPVLGYSRFQVNGFGVKAYRMTYEWTFGPIDENLVVDHLCHNTMCVNPGHLEAVTYGTNSRRSKRYLSETCPNGHPRKAPGGCKECIRSHAKSEKARETRRRYREWEKSITLADDDPRHGSYITYRRYRCRCDACRRGNTEYARSRRERGLS